MQPTRGQPPDHRDHVEAAGPAVEDHGRAVTTTPLAAARYRRAQRADDRRRITLALRGAVNADPAFELAVADLAAITGTPGPGGGRRQMSWERHHIEVVRTAASGHAERAADLLREHLADIGCDPLALRIVTLLRRGRGDGG
ncbi:MAG: hypothetical protein ACRDZY_06935 [Acidimicrobiales bacterium]